ncbi:hypothetical protein JHK87_045294 [Glycine soja]|nr:hypothetical protein JHK87_045294 [Glycine soja]
MEDIQFTDSHRKIKSDDDLNSSESQNQQLLKQQYYSLGLRGWQCPIVTFARTMCSNIQHLRLQNCNLSGEFFPVGLPSFANMKESDLSWNKFTVIPEYIKDFCFLICLNLNG